MALDATHWEVDRQTGNITYTGADHNGVGPTYATVIEFHRWLQGLADDASSVEASNDELDITDNNPSDRSTDNIVTLKAPYNINDAASEHLYDGSIVQNAGADIYDGIVNFGNATVQIQIIQDGVVLTDDWWNTSIGGAATAGSSGQVLEDSGETWTVDEWVGYTIYNTTDGSQSLIASNTADTITATALYGGGSNDFLNTESYVIGQALNGAATSGISHRFMIKTRTAGVDIDARKLYGTSRRFGNTYSEFKISATSRGNNVLALSDATDLNNATSPATVTTWDQFANDNVGFDNTQDVDLNATNEEYYSRWDIGGGVTPASPTINDLYEWSKWITTQGTALNMYGISGELFRGITVDVVTDASATVANDFAAFEAVSWASGAGTGQMLAIDDVNAPTRMWIQVLTGVAPVDNDVINSVANVATTATAAATIVDREPLLTFPFIGASTGSSIIGGYGIGVDSGDLTSSDILFDLDNLQITPPNNVTVNIGGLETTEDYVTVTQRGYRFAYDGGGVADFTKGETVTGVTPAGTYVVAEVVVITANTEGYLIIGEETGGAIPTDATTLTGGTSGATAVVNGDVLSDIDKRQFTLLTSLISTPEVAVVVNETIDTDTPASGILRVQDNNGFYRKLIYSEYTGSTFTITDSGTEDDFGSVNATGGAGALGNNVYVGYLDEISATVTESFTTVYSGADRNLFVRVRDGAGTPIKTFETTVTMSSSGGSATAIRTSDL